VLRSASPKGKETFGIPKLAVLFALILFLIQVGLANFGIQQDFVLGVICWLLITALCIYIVWVWEGTAGFPLLGELFSSLVIAVLIPALLWSPARTQYRREHPLFAHQSEVLIGNQSNQQSWTSKETLKAVQVPNSPKESAEAHILRDRPQSKKPNAYGAGSAIARRRAVDTPDLPVLSPVPATSTSVSWQQLADPAIQLLDRAVGTVRTCHSFQVSSMKRMNEAETSIKESNLRQSLTEQQKSAFAEWKMGTLNREDMQLYSEVYKHEFMEVRSLLVLKGVDEVEPGIDYENP
jgi:hypothetical protein